MIANLLAIFLGLLQATQTGTIVGVVKLPDNSTLIPNARIALLSPKYSELWDKQVQTRLDNYWEIYKPQFAANKAQFTEFDRLAQLEALRYVTATMRRELAENASKFLKDSPTGQFEFPSIPFGKYQLVVQATVNGQEIIWSKPLDVHTEIPIFVDLGKPVS